MSSEISYWSARVMKHFKREGADEYAIHEVFFSEQHEIVTWTVEALSPRENSVEALREALERLLAQPNEEIECGDSPSSYTKGEIEYWLRQIDQPVIDYA